jgi:peptide/nickel transport system permease protein
MRMWVYIIRRGVLVIPVVIGVLTILFAIESALPVQDRLMSQFGVRPHSSQSHPYDPTVPCSTLGIDQPGNCTNPEYQSNLAALGLNKPIPVQWALFVYNGVVFNWGVTNPSSTAVTTIPLPGDAPVSMVLSWYLPYTLELAALAIVLILLLSWRLGMISALERDRPIDHAVRFYTFALYAIPEFLLGYLVLLAAVGISGGLALTCHGYSNTFQTFYGSWPVPQCLPGSPTVLPPFVQPYHNTVPTGFPTVDAALYGGSTGWYLAGDSVARLILPALVIALGTVGAVSRFVRSSVLETMNNDYVRTARGMGIPEDQVIRRHVGRNSLMVTITVMGLLFAGFIAGFPVLEYVFGIEGVGRTFAFAVQPPLYDFGLIFGTTLLFTFIVVFANLAVDVLYAYFDPRVRLG